MEQHQNGNLNFSDADGEDAAINLRHLWHIVLERRWLVVTAFSVVIIFVLIYLFNATKIYQARTTIRIDRESNMLVQEYLPFQAQQEDYLQTQYKTLVSRTMIKMLQNDSDLKLDKDKYFKDSLDLIGRLAGCITVSPIRLTRLVEVKVEHPDKQVAADIANTLAENFKQENLRLRMSSALDAQEFLHDEVGSYGDDVAEAARSLQKYKRDNPGFSFDSEDDILLQSLSKTQLDLSSAQYLLISAKSLQQKVVEHLAAHKSPDEMAQLQDETIKTLKAQLALSEAILAGMKKKYGPLFPKRIEQQASVDQLQASIEREMTNRIQAIGHDVGIAEAQVQKLQAQLSEINQNLLTQKDLQIEYAVKMANYDKHLLKYQQLNNRLEDAKIQGSIKSNNIYIVDIADVPLDPFKPRMVLTLLMGIITGLGAGFGLAFFVNYLDDSVKTQEDIEVYLKLPFLGYIPHIRSLDDDERDMVAHLEPKSDTAESFRTIRASVSLMFKPEQLRTVAIVSTIPSEGKSLVSTNVAIVNAQAGVKTLLVDADLRRPSIHKAFKLHSPKGLASYLMDPGANIEDIKHGTDIPNLDIICAGSVPHNPSELIGSKRMAEFLKEVGQKYDRIVVDCPPVSAVSDPLIIASMCESAIYVMKFNKIRREHARRTVQRVQDAGIFILGTILNDIDFEGKDSYYYSYYYYQNSYYSSHYKTDATGPEKRKLVDSKESESTKGNQSKNRVG